MAGERHLASVASSTFILALDGDVDFEPGAVQLLVDLMKKNEQVGAACGRIHPVGSGERANTVASQVELLVTVVVRLSVGFILSSWDVNMMLESKHSN